MLLRAKRGSERLARRRLPVLVQLNSAVDSDRRYRICLEAMVALPALAAASLIARQRGSPGSVAS